MDVIPYEIIKSNGSIGAILVDSGRLSPENAEVVLRLQKERGLRFGDAAIELGFVTEQDIQHALSNQYDYPYLLPGDRRIDESVIAAFQPFNRVVEQLRVLRSQLMLRWYDPLACPVSVDSRPQASQPAGAVGSGDLQCIAGAGAIPV